MLLIRFGSLAGVELERTSAGGPRPVRLPRGIDVNVLRIIVFTFVCLCVAVPLDAANLKRETVEAFDHYVRNAEARMDKELESGGPFLWVDSLPVADKAVAYTRLRNGEILIQSCSAGLDIPGGMIHDWIGIVFVPNATLDGALAQIQNYDRYAQIYAPAIIRSKLLKRKGDDFTVALRLQRKSFRTVVLDVVSDAQYIRLALSRAYSRSHSIRIAEVENPGTPQEREEPPDEGHGYLWRLSDYRRVLQDASGIYVQFEVIALSRNIPWGLEWLIKPLVTKVPRESLTFTLSRTRASIEGSVKEGYK
jgi:hypothetical protein